MSARVTLVVSLEVEPREGQTETEAAAEMAQVLAEYLTEADKPFFEDYGARAEDLEAFRDVGESPSWGGYEGPFATAVEVSQNGIVAARSDW